MNNVIDYKGVRALIESHNDDPVFISKVIKDVSISLSNQDSISEDNFDEVTDIFEVLSRRHSSYLWRELSRLKYFVDAASKRDSRLIKLLAEVYSGRLSSNDPEEILGVIIAKLVSFRPVYGGMFAYTRFIIHDKGGSINLQVNDLSELILTVSKEFLKNSSDDEIKAAVINEARKVLFSDEWVCSNNLIKDIIKESEAVHTVIGWSCDMLEVKKMLSCKL